MTEPSTGPSRFTGDCATIARILSAGGSDPSGGAADAELDRALRHVTDELPRLLTRRASVVHQDLRDLVQEVLARFLSACSKGLVDPERSPSGYLLRIAMNLVVDAARAAPAPVPLADLGAVLDTGIALPAPAGPETDAVTRLIESLGSRATVLKALDRANRAGDHMVLEVVAAWLDLAAETGTKPGSRAVAQRVGVSKTTVANALQRFTDQVRPQ